MIDYESLLPFVEKRVILSTMEKLLPTLLLLLAFQTQCGQGDTEFVSSRGETNSGFSEESTVTDENEWECAAGSVNEPGGEAETNEESDTEESDTGNVQNAGNSVTSETTTGNTPVKEPTQNPGPSPTEAPKKILPTGCLLSVAEVEKCAQNECGRSKDWYKGNTHAHTDLSNHGDSTPQEVASWYLDHDYDFLVLSEHNMFVRPDSITGFVPPPDFLLIPGEEITGKNNVHTTAMNITKAVPWDFDNAEKTRIAQNHVDGTMAAGGIPIMNHPNYKEGLEADDVAGIRDVRLFELFNGYLDLYRQEGHRVRDSEALWDNLLSRGMVLYGVASDDAHIFKTLGEKLTNPQRGWIMVKSGQLTAGSLMDSLLDGDFYSSSGVYLRSVTEDEKSVSIFVDPERTLREITENNLEGRYAGAAELGFMIDFIGSDGRVLATHHHCGAARYRPSSQDSYVRARISYAIRSGNGFEIFYAWTQPVFK